MVNRVLIGGLALSLSSQVFSQNRADSNFVEMLASKWLQNLSSKPCPADAPAFYNRDFVVKSLQVFSPENQSSADFRLGLVRTLPDFACDMGSADKFKLAGSLLSLRRTLRLLQNLPQKAGKEYPLVMLLLQTLADETLVSVWDKKNQTTPKFFAQFWSTTPVQSGDIFVSKGSAGSSAFLSRLGGIPNFYSHAAVVWRSPDNNEFYLPEAFIEDGVKLRSASNDYFVDPKMNFPTGKRRLAVYRIADTANHLGDWLYEVEKFSLQVLENPLPYDFAANMDDSSAFTCLEVPDFIAKNAKVPTPFPGDTWAPLPQVQQGFFRALGSQVSGTIALPQSIEQSIEGWDWVGYVADLENLVTDRIDGLMIDIFWEFLEDPRNRKAVQKIYEKLQSLPEKIEESHWLFQVAKQKGLIIPEGMNFKELVFFGLLDKWVVVEVRKFLTQRNQISLTKTGRSLTLEEIRWLLTGYTKDRLTEWLKGLEETKN